MNSTSVSVSVSVCSTVNEDLQGYRRGERWEETWSKVRRRCRDQGIKQKQFDQNVFDNGYQIHFQILQKCLNFWPNVCQTL